MTPAEKMIPLSDRPSLFPTIRFGADYNPEQWPRDVWDEDVRLMKVAGITTATVGVFSWARLEPRPGHFDFEWLDVVMDKLHGAAVRVCLATATASPPPWLAFQYPGSLPVTAEGTQLGVGSRQQYSPSSSEYREHAVRLVEKLAQRYRQHPALESWHVNNEYGCHVARSHDPESAAAFRRWLEARYGSVEALNEAWGTDVWSQRYGSFGEVSTPGAMPATVNPLHALDFDRFSSDALRELYLAELAVLRRVSPGVPVTTNFMGFHKDVDYWSWAPYIDFVSDDHYPDPGSPDAYLRAAATRDLMRSLGGGKPWILMEQATSAVSWRARNAPKPSGLHRVHSLQAIARGADGILHFQWRAARSGAEKFHSAIIPHGGEETRIFRESADLGAEIAALSADHEVLGREVPASVAIVVDWDSWRAVEQEANPTTISYVDTMLEWYRPFLRRGITVDFVAPCASLQPYALVVVPVQQVASRRALEVLAEHVTAGGTLLVTYQSGILDENLQAYLGGYLGPLQDTLGVHVEEFAPLAAAGDLHTGAPAETELASVTLTGELAGTAELWQEIVIPRDAEVLASFGDGFAAGQPAVTRRPHPSGSGGVGWYVATQPGRTLLDKIVARALEDATVSGLLDEPKDGFEAVRRGSTLFLLNHTNKPVRLVVESCWYTVEAYGCIYVGCS